MTKKPKKVYYRNKNETEGFAIPNKRLAEQCWGKKNVIKVKRGELING